MRRFIFSLLILLTAFRGIVGDVMAYEMTAGMLKTSTAATQSMDSDAIKSVALSADSMPATPQIVIDSSAAKSCHESAKDNTAAFELQTDASEHSCTACMVCHSPSLERSAIASALPKFASAFFAVQHFSWMSADLIQLQKPPVF